MTFVKQFAGAGTDLREARLAADLDGILLGILRYRGALHRDSDQQ
jgi:hypothetical protein